MLGRNLNLNIMSETKTYVFGNDGQCGGGGMMSLLAPLLQRNGLDPNLLLAMNKNNNGWGEGGGFMWVIFLFFLMGWGGNGWGGFGGNGRGAIANEINNDYGRSLLMDAIGGNRTLSPISPLSSTVPRDRFRMLFLPLLLRYRMSVTRLVCLVCRLSMLFSRVICRLLSRLPIVAARPTMPLQQWMAM